MKKFIANSAKPVFIKSAASSLAQEKSEHGSILILHAVDQTLLSSNSKRSMAVARYCAALRQASAQTYWSYRFAYQINASDLFSSISK